MGGRLINFFASVPLSFLPLALNWGLRPGGEIGAVLTVLQLLLVIVQVFCVVILIKQKLKQRRASRHPTLDELNQHTEQARVTDIYVPHIIQSFHSEPVPVAEHTVSGPHAEVKRKILWEPEASVSVPPTPERKRKILWNE